jgi:DNA-binding response OmpR family regulator
VNNQALIIEDDADLAIIFAEAIKAAGFETQIIRDGKIALTQLLTSAPGIVVLDLHLPNVSGATILDRIRANARLTQTLVIVTTADARLADMLQTKADLVLVKPISFGQLRDLAKRLKSSVAPSQRANEGDQH